MSNPFILDVHEIIRQQGAPEEVHTSGDTPQNLGGDMLAIREGKPVTIDVLLTNLGEAIMADGTVTGTATGMCSRCLRPLETELEIDVTEVFGIDPDFITSDSEDGEGDEEDDTEDPPMVEFDRIDLTQAVINEAGLNAPFSPICADYGIECESSTPAPDGISEEVEESDEPDPRWAGLAKFKDLIEDPDDAAKLEDHLEENPDNGS